VLSRKISRLGKQSFFFFFLIPTSQIEENGCASYNVCALTSFKLGVVEFIVYLFSFWGGLDSDGQAQLCVDEMSPMAASEPTLAHLSLQPLSLSLFHGKPNTVE
jgi:hypothetical protein